MTKRNIFVLDKKWIFLYSKQSSAATSQPADPNESESNSESAEKKLEVLTKTFQSLTEKKSKMEIAFQADKKQLIVNLKKDNCCLNLYLLYLYLFRTLPPFGEKESYGISSDKDTFYY